MVHAHTVMLPIDTTPVVYIANYSTATELRFSVDRRWSNGGNDLPLGGQEELKALDADLLESMIYWIDAGAKVNYV